MADQRAQYNEEAVGANHPTKADVINRLALVEHGTDGVHGAAARASMGTAPLVLGSDADGDMYYRASSLLARLAKGAANTKLFMNAGATAPEWAVGLKVITAIRAMDSESGSVNYTGVGFKPSAVLILSSQNGTGIWSIGIQDIGAVWSLYGYQGNWYNYANLVYLIEAIGKIQSGSITTWGADGFTITWTRTGVTAAGDVRMLFLCFR